MTSAPADDEPMTLFNYIGDAIAEATQPARMLSIVREPAEPAAEDAGEDTGEDAREDAQRPPSMHEKITAEQESNPKGHVWIAAAEVRIDIPTARRASFRGSFRTQEDMRIDALEVYCRLCRRPLDEVGAESDCDAKIDNTHLIGGNPGERAKRKVPEIRGVIKKQVIDRRGMAGYSVHAGR